MDQNEIKEWSQKAGLSPIAKLNISVEDIVQFCSKKTNDISINDLEDIILKSIAYNIYIKSMKGAILARITQLSDILRQKIGIQTQQMDKWLNRDEKESAVIVSSNELKTMNDELVQLRMKYSRIKDIPLSLDTAIGHFKFLLNRKINEQPK